MRRTQKLYTRSEVERMLRDQSELITALSRSTEPLRTFYDVERGRNQGYLVGTIFGAIIGGLTVWLLLLLK